MPAIRVDVSGDHEKVGREAGIDRLPLIHTTSDWTLAALEHGMQSGATSLMAIIPATVDGLDVLVMAETSLQCWMMAAAVLRGRFSTEVERPGYALLNDAARAVLLPRFSEAIRRSVPAATADQADQAAAMLLDALGAGDDSL